MSSSLATYDTSRRQMALFKSNRLSPSRPSPPSASTPPTGVTDISWDDRTPPPYNVAVRRAELYPPSEASIRAGQGHDRNNFRMTRSGTSRKHNSKIFSRRSHRGQIVKPISQTLNRIVRPGLLVDTTVTRHQAQTPKQVFPSTIPALQQNESVEGTRCSPAATLDRGAYSPRWHHPFSTFKQAEALGTTESQGYAADQGQLSRAPSIPWHHRNVSSSTTDITPSDKAITIGFVPSADASTALGVTSTRQLRASATPIIHVTPAQDDMGWSLPQNVSAFKEPRWRPVSSVYSQATGRTPALRQTAQPPPIPSFPSYLATNHKANAESTYFDKELAYHPSNQRDSAWTTFEEQEEEPHHAKRTLSTGTWFEEDEAPILTAPTKLTIDTTLPLPTPRRSRGWWNFITTPFDFRSPGGRSLKSPTSAVGQAPPVPIFSPAAHLQNHVDHRGDPLHMAHDEGESQSIDRAMEAFSFTDYRPFNRGTNNEIPQEASLAEEGHNHSGHGHGLGVTIGDFPFQSRHLVEDQDSTNRDAPLLLEKSVEEKRGSVDHHNAQRASVHVMSPLSGDTETPIVQVAALGIMQTPRAVETTPNIHQTRPLYRNAPLPHETLKLRHPETAVPAPVLQTVYVPRQGYQQHNLGQVTTNRSPPMTSFPGPLSFGNERTTKGLAPVEDQVRSVWEKDDQASSTTKTPKSKSGCFGRRRPKSNVVKRDKKKRRYIICCCCIGLLVLVALLIGLAVALSHRHKSNPPNGDSNTTKPTKPTKKGGTETSKLQWVNLTSFPPMPVGQMNVAQPTLLAQVNSCVNPTTLWSCDLPKDAQSSNLPGGPDQPSFTLEIRYSNNSASSKGITRKLRFARDLGGSAFDPSPLPPSMNDQKFLGNTTDHNNAPFQGEDTPFFFSLQSTAEDPPTNTKVKRDNTPARTKSAHSSSSQGNFATAIPSPSTLDDGTAAPGNLFPEPLPTSQPVMLYNRGTDKEHYGFYVYFDRSIFLKSVSINNVSEIDPGQVTADKNGGSTKDGATTRCTWTETRFLVQIWTRSDAPLLNISTTNSSSSSSKPPDFPYPITITTDRHGGTPSGKMIYCYALDANSRPAPMNNTLMMEDRASGGTLINGIDGPFGNVVIDPKKGGPGGMDGGTGGCGCRWGNWKDTTGL